MCLPSFFSSFIFMTVLFNKVVVGNKKEINCGNKAKLINRRVPYSLLCHDQETDDDLQSADDRGFSFPDDSIFFVEATCEGGLDFRQACAVESAARAHPTRQINVLFAGPVARVCTRNKPLSTLLRYKNIKLFRIHRKKFSKGTPLESFIASNILDKKSRYPVHHSSDVLKLLTLYKFGGIYLDLDVVVLKSLDSLPQPRNWVGKESASSIGSALIALSKDDMGRDFADEAIEFLRDEFNPMGWSDNGNGVLTKAYHRLCFNNTDSCKDFRVYDQSYFYPLESWQYRNFFRRNLVNMTNSYTIHMWNYVAKGQKVQSESPYDKIAQLHCPRTQKLIRHIKNYKLTQVSRTKTDTLYGNIVINEKETIEKRQNARHRMRSKDFAVPKVTVSELLKVVFRRRAARDDLRQLGTRFLFFSNGSHRNALLDRSHMSTYNDVKIEV